MDEKRIAGFEAVGSDDYGETVQIVARMANGSAERITMDYALLPRFVDLLRAAGRMALGHRQGKAAPALDMVEAYTCRSTQTGRAASAEVALRVFTHQGVPVQIMFKPEQVASLIEQLTEELGKPPPTFMQN